MNLLENVIKEENHSSNDSQADSLSSNYSNIPYIQDIEPIYDIVEDDGDLEQEDDEGKLYTEAWDYMNDEYYLKESSTEEAFERIICIELINNDKVYINYQTDWTLRDVKFIFIILLYIKAFRRCFEKRRNHKTLQ